MSIKDELIKRKLPQVCDEAKKGDWNERREEIVDILRKHFGGYPPEFEVTVKGEILQHSDDAYGNKAVMEKIQLIIKTKFNSFSFPFSLVYPKKMEKVPVFVYLGFNSQIADGIGEEITDRGYAVAHICYQDMAPDKDDNFENGLGSFCSRNPFDSWGKLGMWAYGASRVLDYLLTREEFDSERIAIAGHSRLGKAALWCGAQDERFSLVISNDSGGGGAALFRGKTGEKISNLAGAGSRIWFCGNFFEYTDKEEQMIFDQHFLLAAAAPRHLYVASATEDAWADPYSELLSAAAASEAWKKNGLMGLAVDENSSFEDIIPDKGYHEGYIGYHLRTGSHFIGREDWNLFMDYRDRHKV